MTITVKPAGHAPAGVKPEAAPSKAPAQVTPVVTAGAVASTPPAPARAGASTFEQGPAPARAPQLPATPIRSRGLGLEVLGEALPATEVRASLPISKLTTVGASASGEVFLLDAQSVGAMEVRVRQLELEGQGAATELSFRLTPAMSRALAATLTQQPPPGLTTGEFVIERGEFKDGATHLVSAAPYRPSQQGPTRADPHRPIACQRLVETGKFVVEFVPQRGVPQSYRDRVSIRVFGGSDAERQANLEAAVARLGLRELIADADPLQAQRLVRLSLLRMVDPLKAEQLGQTLDSVSLSALDDALAARNVDPSRVAQAKLEEVFPGHMAVVDPALGAQYQQLGVKALMVGVCYYSSVAKILASDGLMSSSERYGRGVQREGASMTTDEESGGAEFAFARLVTSSAMAGFGQMISDSFAAGQVQLISVGEPMRQQLSRTDWHAFPADSFGTTVSQAQADADPADDVLKPWLSNYAYHFTGRPVLGELISQIEEPATVNGVKQSGAGYKADNEACFKAGVPARSFTHAVVANEAGRKALIEALEDSGLKDFNGLPFDQAIVVASSWKQVGEKLGLTA